VVIRGPLVNKAALIDGTDSQPVSALLIAAAFASHPIELYVKSAGEKPWVDLTLHWFKQLGIPYTRRGHSFYCLQGRSIVPGFVYSVPGDWSSAAFPIAAALLTQSKLVLEGCDLKDVQGDKQFLILLQQMGAHFSFEGQNLIVQKGNTLQGMQIDVNDCIDALPILAVIGCFAKGKTTLVNAAAARHKESDRIACICKELKKMGAKIEEMPDGLLIHSCQLHGALLHAHGDHRLALSLSVAALAADTPSRLTGADCIRKTYPNFVEAFCSIQGDIRGV
jgi:3-phosphoshikimate 1-carboxyvinyltransferase